MERITITIEGGDRTKITALAKEIARAIENRAIPIRRNFKDNTHISTLSRTLTDIVGLRTVVDI